MAKLLPWAQAYKIASSELRGALECLPVMASTEEVSGLASSFKSLRAMRRDLKALQGFVSSSKHVQCLASEKQRHDRAIARVVASCQIDGLARRIASLEASLFGGKPAMSWTYPKAPLAAKLAIISGIKPVSVVRSMGYECTKKEAHKALTMGYFTHLRAVTVKPIGAKQALTVVAELAPFVVTGDDPMAAVIGTAMANCIGTHDYAYVGVVRDNNGRLVAVGWHEQFIPYLYETVSFQIADYYDQTPEMRYHANIDMAYCNDTHMSALSSLMKLDQLG